MAVPKYTDEEMLDALRSAVAASGSDAPLSATRYDEHRLAAGGPSCLAIIKRFGTWRVALQAAGLSANQASARRPRWTEEELVDWVARYLAVPECSGSYNGYASWAKSVDGAPSGATVRNAFRHWSVVRDRAERT